MRLVEQINNCKLNYKKRDITHNFFDRLAIITATNSKSQRLPILIRAIKEMGSQCDQYNITIPIFVVVEWGEGLSQNDRNLIKFTISKYLLTDLIFQKASKIYTSDGHSFNEGIRAIYSKYGTLDIPIMKHDDDSYPGEALYKKMLDCINEHDCGIVAPVTIRTGYDMSTDKNINLIKSEYPIIKNSVICNWSSNIENNKLHFAKVLCSLRLSREFNGVPNENGITFHPSVIDLIYKGCGFFFDPEVISGPGISLYFLYSHFFDNRIITNSEAHIYDRLANDHIQCYNWGIQDMTFANYLNNNDLLINGFYIFREVHNKIVIQQIDNSEYNFGFLLFPERLVKLITTYKNNIAFFEEFLSSSEKQLLRQAVIYSESIIRISEEQNILANSKIIREEELVANRDHEKENEPLDLYTAKGMLSQLMGHYKVSQDLSRREFIFSG